MKMTSLSFLCHFEFRIEYAVQKFLFYLNTHALTDITNHIWHWNVTCILVHYWEIVEAQTKIKQGRIRQNDTQGIQSHLNHRSAKQLLYFASISMWKNVDKNTNFRYNVWNICLPEPPHPKDQERNPWPSHQGLGLIFCFCVFLFSL